LPVAAADQFGSRPADQPATGVVDVDQLEINDRADLPHSSSQHPPLRLQIQHGKHLGVRQPVDHLATSFTRHRRATRHHRPPQSSPPNSFRLRVNDQEHAEDGVRDDPGPVCLGGVDDRVRQAAEMIYQA
jgi:hypothetical protein